MTAEHVRAAQYVRMSTDHQRYSTANQCAVLAQYAQDHELDIVRTYADEGCSGLRVAGRPALAALLADVQCDQRDYTVLLVYDVSRWGRFQDADEAAYYEHLCQRAGVRVVYCAEPFENDGSPLAAIVKSVKRAMAGEFSRELSVKVFAAQCRLVKLGFRQGGPAPFGFRRELKGPDGVSKGALHRGQRKCLQDDRVVLELADNAELRWVRQIFAWFVRDRLSCAAIAARLDARAVARADGRRWRGSTVRAMLSNETYIGNTIYARSTNKLKQGRRLRPAGEWVRAEGTHQAIVSFDLFQDAQRRFAEMRLPPDEMRVRLATLLRQEGRLTADLIDRAEHLPSARLYAERFGSLFAAYASVGYHPTRLRCKADHPNRSRRTRWVAEVLQALEQRGVCPENLGRGLFRINAELTFSLSAARPVRGRDEACWVVRRRADVRPDLWIIARLDASGARRKDYVILPRAVTQGSSVRLRASLAWPYSPLRFDTLEPVFALVAGSPVTRLPDGNVAVR